MRSRPAYSPCKLFYDGAANLAVGDYLRTPAGSAYLVTGMRPDRRREYRRHLACLRWPVAEIPADATVHPLYWYPRQRKAARRLADLAT